MPQQALSLVCLDKRSPLYTRLLTLLNLRQLALSGLPAGSANTAEGSGKQEQQGTRRGCLLLASGFTR